MKQWIRATGVLALAASHGAALGGDDAIDALRQELRLLRQEYESRIRSLEERLEQAEATSVAQPGVEAAPVEAVPSPTSPGRGPLTGSAFNPAISAVVQAKLSTYSEDPEDYAIPGFQLGGETGLPPEGFSLDETELTLSANVDTLFYGEVTLGFHEDEQETEVEVEEAFFDTLSLPAGLGLRGGRFYSGIGYLNRFHSHAWDFQDQPLAYRAFLGDQYRDDGVRLTWLAATDLYLDLGGELLQGNQFPGGDSSDAQLGDSRTAFAHLGGDLGTSHSWRAGLSGLWINAHDRRGDGHHHGDDGGGTRFGGDSNLAILDFVWKWAPNGNPRNRNWVFQTEYFYREEDGDLTFNENGMTALLDYDGDQQGWYAQAVYQFLPRWRLGLRYDWLDPDNELKLRDAGGLDPDEVLEETGLDVEGHEPERWSLMADWSPSEFSRLRLQYNRDQSRPDDTDHQWTLQYIMSLGAHGAHEF